MMTKRAKRVKGKLIDQNSGMFQCPVCGQKWMPYQGSGGYLYGSQRCPNENCKGRE